MRNVNFVIPVGEAISNTRPIAPNLLCGLYIPANIAGTLLTLEVSFATQPSTYYTLDRTIDLSQATNKNLVHTQWQTYTCGFDNIRLKTDVPQTVEIVCIGGVLLV